MDMGQEELTFMEINGIKLGIYYRLKEGGPVLVFIHGYPGQISNWKYLLRYFEERCSVVAYDQRGFGSSDKPQIVSFHDYINDLRELLRTLGIDEKDSILIGHSFGGLVAEWYTGEHEVKGLVLIGSIVEVKASLMDKILWNTPPWLWKWLLYTDNPLTRRLYRNLFFSPSTPYEVFKEFMEDNRDYIEGLPGYVFQYGKYYCGNNAEGVLKKISCPTLILVGRDDRVTPPEESRRIHELIPHSKLVILENSGHMVLYERPSELNRLIEEFILSIHE
ncbi:MAG: alpha/beta hydrolase [Candidatus Korarchaeota archaeon]|nr:alpha/beta hydrolase [Candidatus Korarchaeota archaeon]